MSDMRKSLKRHLLLFCLLLFAVLPTAAAAEVVATFWSHDRDQNYEHAFIVLNGTVDATGQRVNTNIGFTASRISPMVLLGPVAGRMERVSAGYIARETSRPHFRIVLDDAAYARLTAFIARWRAVPQPSYNLNNRNCVHFVMEAAAILGLSVNRQTAHNRAPRQALEEIVRLNPRVERASR
jgi:hypothetical protein